MAEILIRDNLGNQDAGVKKSKKHSTKVDLTPMVDLGFLLITFFIFTTSMTKPNVMNLNMPKDSFDKNRTPVKASGSLTLLLSKKNIIYYYFGKDSILMQTTDYRNVRHIILDKKSRTKADDFYVIIKPDKDATYKNAVDLLDEMNINDVTKYAMVDPSVGEDKLIRALEKK